MLNVKLAKNYEVNGYQVAISQKKNFKKSKKQNVVKGYSQSALFDVKKGKTYYVKVRTYVLDSSGKECYSAWSKAKKVKIK
ncbi:MAG: hypothetical protein K6F55_07830 [Eubacterium sp.]|nr:hypothetical protein [Eubacterium sp.]